MELVRQETRCSFSHYFARGDFPSEIRTDPECWVEVTDRWPDGSVRAADINCRLEMTPRTVYWIKFYPVSAHGTLTPIQ
jgi:hypothetical protein